MVKRVFVFPTGTASQIKLAVILGIVATQGSSLFREPVSIQQEYPIDGSMKLTVSWGEKTEIGCLEANYLSIEVLSLGGHLESIEVD